MAKSRRATNKKSSVKNFQYKGRSRDQLKKRAQGGGDFDRIIKQSVPTFRPSEGKHKFRLLPPTWDDPEHYGVDLFIHHEIGPDKDQYLCPQKMNGGKCPICEERNRANKAGEEEYAKSLQPRKRVAVYMVDRNNEDEGVQVWTMPVSVDQEIADRCEDPDTGDILPVDHPDEGYDITFSKSGQGLKTKYTGVEIGRRPTPLSDDEDKYEQWMQFAIENPLPEVLNIYDYDHIKSQLMGGVEVPSDDDDDDEDEEPPKKSKPSKSKRRDEDEDDEDDEDEDEGGNEGTPDADEIREMDRKELRELIKEHELEIKTRGKDPEDIAEEVIEELGLEDEDSDEKEESDDEDGDDEEEEQPKRRSRKRPSNDDDDEDDEDEDDKPQSKVGSKLAEVKGKRRRS